MAIGRDAPKKFGYMEAIGTILSQAILDDYLCQGVRKHLSSIKFLQFHKSSTDPTFLVRPLYRIVETL